MKSAVTLVAAMLAAAVLPASAQEKYPSKPITIVIPVAPGGSIDPPMRIIAEIAQAELGQPVVIENLPGGGTTIGTAKVARAKPDGYMLGIAASGNIVSAAALGPVPYDIEKSFIYISRLVTTPVSVLVHKDSPFKTFKDIVDYAKANPGKLRWAGSGIGTTSHMIGSAAFREENLQTVALPTNGASEAILSLLGKHVEVAIMGGWWPNYASGDLRPVAETGPNKIPDLPDVPRLRDLGYKVDLTTFVGVMAPAGTPPDIVQRWEGILKAAVETQRFKAFLAESKQTSAYLNSKDFTTTILGEAKTAAALAEELKLKK